MNNSEVARLRAEIEAQYVAGQQALSGVAAGTARHQIITARLERMCALQQELAGQIGERAAMHLLCEVLECHPLPTLPPPSALSECHHTDKKTSD